MILHKNINGVLHYWKIINLNRDIIINWGKVGEFGEQRKLKSGFFSGQKNELQKEIKNILAKGFSELEENQNFYLEIEFKIEETKHFQKEIQDLKNLINDYLELVGLGYVKSYDDNSVFEPGFIEINCVVYEFELAKKVLEEKLKDLNQNYTRIFEWKT